MPDITLIGGRGAIGTRLSSLFKALAWRVHIYDRCEQYENDYRLPPQSDVYIWLATVHHNRDVDGHMITDFTDDIDMYHRYLNLNDLRDAWHIYFSSSHVYATAAGRVTIYGQYKRRVEKLFQSYTPNLLILRPFFVIDAYRRGSTQQKFMGRNGVYAHNEPIWYSDCHLLARTCVDFVTNRYASIRDIRYPQKRTIADLYGYAFPRALSREEENIIP